jgi:hypothetical protein
VIDTASTAPTRRTSDFSPGHRPSGATKQGCRLHADVIHPAAARRMTCSTRTIGRKKL